MGVMLDTTVLIAVERRRFDLDAFLVAEGDPEMFLSAVTVSELLQGVHQATTPHKETRLQFIEDYLTTIPVLSFDVDVARVHAMLRAQLRMAGTPVGDHDLLIAATALQHNVQIITMDQRSFPRVPGLRSRLVGPTKPTP